MQKKKIPQLLKGTRDFDAFQVAKRNYIFNNIQRVYQQYGFMPLETPALEYLSSLLGHYGQEGEQLVFRVLKSGNFLAEVAQEECYQDYKSLLPKLADKGLRYDLTVPLMRYVAMHYQELVFPFKRYQIQPVWRAERPQKERYREFYQCDADIIGTSSLLCEAEILAMAHGVLQKLGITHFNIHLNHRFILNGIAALLGELDRVNEFCITIDKLDKVGKENVIEELLGKGFSRANLEKFAFIFDLQGNNELKLGVLREHLESSEIGLKGVQEIKQILQHIEALGIAATTITVDLSLARGLAYYTGAVFEIKLPSINMGSIAGGGRYDNFADNFGLTGLTGVGLSFGIDRLYAAMEQFNLFPRENQLSTQVMFTNLDKESERIVLGIIMELRSHGIAVELYPDQAKLKKQLTYANKKAIPFVVIMGEEERQAAKFRLKDMHTGNQSLYTLKELWSFLGGCKNLVAIS